MLNRMFLVISLLLGCFISTGLLAQEPGYPDASTLAVVDDVVAVPVTITVVPNVPVAEPTPVAVVVDVDVPADSVATVSTEVAATEPLFVDVSTPGNLIAIMAAVVPIAIELFIKPIPGIMPWMIRLISLGFGAIGGLLVGLGLFVSVPYTLATSILCGIAGGGGFTLIKWGSQAARGSKRPLIATAITGVVLLCMISIVGCGRIFTVTNGDPVTFGMKVSKPSYGAIYVKAVETCKVNNPLGTIKVENICDAGLVSTMAVDGKEPTCVVNPCVTDKFVFLPTGHTACQ